MLSSWGLRSRLVLLVGVALTPVFGLFGWVSAENQDAALRLAQARLQSDALLIAAHEQPLVESAKQLLGDIANSSTVQNKQANLCGDYLRSLQALQPAYAGLGVVATDGTVLCHSRPVRVGIDASAHPLFKRALLSRQFEIGEYDTERSSGKAGVGFVMPVYSPTGVLSAVAFTAVDVHAFRAALAEVAVPAGVSVSLTDRKGTVLATHPWVARPLARCCLTPRSARFCGTRRPAPTKRWTPRASSASTLLRPCRGPRAARCLWRSACRAR